MKYVEYAERPIFQIATLGSLILILYYPVLRDLVMDWIIDENYSHGFLIPLVSAFFIWRRRTDLSGIRRNSCWVGLVVLLGGLCLYLLASIAAEYFTMRLSLLVVVGGLILYLWGRKMTAQLLFPLLYLAFMIPIPYVIYYSLSFPLELLASRWTVFAVHLLGLPIFREGNILYLENTTLQVIDACSGLRSLISLSALSAAMAYVMQKTLLKGLILFSAAVPIALLANVLRLSMTAVLASLYGEQVAQGFFHQFSGIMVFAFAVLALALLGGFLRWLPFKKNIG